ncbi:DNA-directed RNA polymerase subunit K [Candidatus Woesearchaeota archaeon]|nr:DNA-directed RNA polymerase subunit K [Candidatus Woesearchaeota archaeon]
MTQPPKTQLTGYTKFERARIIGSRALQIAQGAPFLVKLSQEQLQQIKYNPVEIAKKEFEAGVLPIDVRRPEIKKKAK